MWGFQDVFNVFFYVVLLVFHSVSISFSMLFQPCSLQVGCWISVHPRLPPWSMASRRPPSTGRGRWILGAASLDRPHMACTWHAHGMHMAWHGYLRKIDKAWEITRNLFEARICLLVPRRFGWFPGFPELWLLRLPTRHYLTQQATYGQKWTWKLVDDRIRSQWGLAGDIWSHHARLHVRMFKEKG